MKTVAGPAFVLSGAILNVLIWGVPGIFLGTLYGHAIVALRKQRVMVWGYGSVAVAAVALYLFAIPRFGVWGAAGITILSEAAIAAITFLLVSRTIRALPNLRIAGKALLAALGMTVFLLALHPGTSIIISIPLSGLIYVALLALMRAVPKDMLRSVLGLSVK
jgi:O-antigen/teichoic acid export membrane protein